MLANSHDALNWTAGGRRCPQLSFATKFMSLGFVRINHAGRDEREQCVAKRTMLHPSRGSQWMGHEGGKGIRKIKSCSRHSIEPVGGAETWLYYLLIKYTERWGLLLPPFPSMRRSAGEEQNKTSQEYRLAGYGIGRFFLATMVSFGVFYVTLPWIDYCALWLMLSGLNLFNGCVRSLYRRNK